jgi:hypothetical protein
MTTEQAIELSDLQRLADAEAPDLVAAVSAFLEQEEPERSEPLPDDAITLDALRAALKTASKPHDKKRRQSQAHEAWKRYLNQPAAHISPRMGLADLIVGLYEKKTPAARAALLLLATEAPLEFGVWGGLKRVFKRAEHDFDAELFAELGVRFDLATQYSANRGDVGRGTLIYLRRRAGRFLRLLGKASPELYPSFAVELLRRYPLDTRAGSSEVAARVMAGTSKKWGAPKGLAKDKRFRPPYLEAWKQSADPLLLLLETCQCDMAASFAILGLRELHPEVFRSLSPEWLARLAYRPLSSAHDFLVEVLEGSPQLHQGNIAQLGLKAAVLRLLSSPSAKARKYAIEYARGHATDLATERLVEILESAVEYKDTVSFIVGVLTARRPARSLGLVVLGRLLRFDAARAFAAAALETEFEQRELTEQFLLDLLLDDDDATRKWVRKYIDKLPSATTVPVTFWLQVLDDPRLDEVYGVDDYAKRKLVKYPLTSVPGEWLLTALGRDDIGSEITSWLEKADALPPSLDLERIRGLIFDPSKRQIAFNILGNPKIVPPGQVGLAWLLALARRADPALHEWAHRYLLVHVKPELFSDGKPSIGSGVARLFALASGQKEPEAIRAFAQLYLRCHHPKLGKREAETKQYGIKPAIPREAYSEERVWPCLFDVRADVRRFGVTITRLELRRWKAGARIYELAESANKEVRNVAYDALFQAGEADADPDLAIALDELDAAQIFSLTESRRRPTRDAGMDLIRKHYERIGGVERLGWLMQSADREVRLFAVRLLWEKHRPRGLPPGWRPASGKPLPQGETFADAEALRALLRRLLFMVPPVRSAEATDQVRAKKLPASVAKRHVIAVVRDLGLADAAFAQVVAPVLGEFTGSVAKGEWQACLAALMQLRAAHGLAVEGLV